MEFKLEKAFNHETQTWVIKATLEITKAETFGLSKTQQMAIEVGSLILAWVAGAEDEAAERTGANKDALEVAKSLRGLLGSISDRDMESEDDRPKPTKGQSTQTSLAIASQAGARAQKAGGGKRGRARSKKRKDTSP